MRIGLLGSGGVGTTLAGGFLAHGHEVMVGSREPDKLAKDVVARLLDQLGWDAEDMGGVEAARAIEPLCILWCIPGFRHNQWTHAFKLLK